MTTLRHCSSCPILSFNRSSGTNLTSSWHGCPPGETSTLDVSGSFHLTDLNDLFLKQYPNLRKLILSDCFKIASLDPLKDLPHLEEVDCRGCLSLPEDLQIVLTKRDQPALFETWSISASSQSSSELTDTRYLA